MVWNKWFSNSFKDRGNGGMQTITRQQTAPHHLFHTSKKAKKAKSTDRGYLLIKKKKLFNIFPSHLASELKK